MYDHRPSNNVFEGLWYDEPRYTKGPYAVCKQMESLQIMCPVSELTSPIDLVIPFVWLIICS